MTGETKSASEAKSPRAKAAPNRFTEKVVVYTGNQHYRTISDSDWALLDITQATLNWDVDNQHALPADAVSAEALAYLLANEDDEFSVVERPILATDEAPAGM